MSGYDVAKDISAVFEGTYIPSSGVIYPTLQWLEDQGYAKGSRFDGKTVYGITESGKKYLRQNEENLNEIAHFIQKRKEGAEFLILQSAARLQRTIVSNLPDMTKENKAKVSKILEEANEKVLKLVVS